MTTTAWVAGCTSWYKNASGRVTNNWPTWTFRYWYDTLRLRPADLGVTGGSPRARPPAAAGSAEMPARSPAG